MNGSPVTKSSRPAIGIMQGRLSAPTEGRIQSFPRGHWRAEFASAREAGLACIEWIYEANTDQTNPLRTDDGLREMRRLAEESGVGVRSVCADYYMEYQLVAPAGEPVSEHVHHLQWLIGRAAAIGVRYIVLPFVDSSSLATTKQIEGLKRIFAVPMAVAERAGIELHLETDLEPRTLVSLLESLGSPTVKANYDIGNSASLGHDPREELMALRTRLGSVHVKDRVKGGGPVPLGTGAADFPTCFRLIGDTGFAGPYILQAAREPDIDEVSLARRNRLFVETHLAALSVAAH